MGHVSQMALGRLSSAVSPSSAYVTCVAAVLRRRGQARMQDYHRGDDRARHEGMAVWRTWQVGQYPEMTAR